MAGDRERRVFTLTLLGDVMLGRLIDQLLPAHVEEPDEARAVNSFRSRASHLKTYNHQSPWGNTLPLLHSSDLVLANLETAVTVHPTKWPDKVFNYRMHPENIKCLTEAGVDYVSLANNHTLDFCEEGLLETVKTVRAAEIQFAGVGETEEEARSPATLTLPNNVEKGKASRFTIYAYSFSDHPDDWREMKSFNFVEYSSEFRQRIRSILTNPQSQAPAMKIVSVHWGPNYAWKPASEIIRLAHFLVDECGVDIIHGHSSHHIQGIEIYKSKLIIYGCGDFVDDYAVHDNYRNDLSAAWRITVAEAEGKQDQTGLEVVKLEVFPNRIKQFQAGLLDRTDADHEWVCSKFRSLCTVFGTKVEEGLGDEGQMVVIVKTI